MSLPSSAIVRCELSCCRIVSMLLLIAVAAACSFVPPTEWPPFEQRTIRVAYESTSEPIEAPASRESLTILAWRVEPSDVLESWQDGRRVLRPAAGTQRVTITCTYRAYAHDGAIPTPQQLFVGASRIEDLP